MKKVLFILVGPGGNGGNVTAADGIFDAYAAARERERVLREALDRYAQHTHGCNALHGGKCDPVCGRDAILRGEGEKP
jgi:hypothetical protein